jgi:hypothetical protein
MNRIKKLIETGKIVKISLSQGVVKKELESADYNMVFSKESAKEIIFMAEEILFKIKEILNL